MIIDRPHIVKDIEVSYGGDTRLSELMPPMEEIPSEFKNMRDLNHKWCCLIDDWFFAGLDIKKIKPKDNINPNDAIRHIATILRSRACTHEHKRAACAFLASKFFEDISYLTINPPSKGRVLSLKKE